MQQIETFTDERNQSWCIHCTRWLSEVKNSRDHVPTRSLLRQPYPTNLPVVTICEDCNRGFSKDEEYLLVFLSAVLSGSTDPTCQSNSRAAAALRRNEKLKARIERAKIAYKTISGKSQFIWKPEPDRVRRVLVKNARGHAFYEYGEPLMADPVRVWFTPLQCLNGEERVAFEDTGGDGVWPEVGSRMMTRLASGHDLVDMWVDVQPGTYRYAVFQANGLVVRIVLHEYLAVEVVWGP
jgi:hypothetical protein